MEQEIQTKGLVERLYWLIRLRWIAIIGVVLTILLTKTIVELPLPVLPLYIVAVILGAYNLIFCLLLGRLKRSESPDLYKTGNRIANLQIALDLTCLTVLIHFSGGVENPFIFYFIFHMIIASILLTRRASFFQATYAVLLFLGMVSLEYAGVLPHYCLIKVIPYALHQNLLYISGVSFVFISTVYIAVYMATSISKKLREREEGLWKANKLLQEKDRIKSEYVLRVTHDIKEDLAAIQSCVEPVTDGIVGSLTEGQNDLLQRVTRRSKSLIQYVDALLGITQLKLAKKLTMEYFLLPALIKELAEHVTLLLKEKNIAFKCEIDPEMSRIKGVRTNVKEAILNLLMNAIKYTPENGKVIVRIREKEEVFRILVKDTGIGIPKDEVHCVFDELYRASNAREVVSRGTGLGLSITKQIVEMHGGRMWVESEEGKGSSFFIELPKRR